MKKIDFKSIAIAAVFSITLLACNDDDPQVESIPPQTVNLLSENLFPEGIIARDNGDIFIGGFGNGEIQRITNGDNVEVFVPSGQEGSPTIAVGMAIDESRQRLWVANFNFDVDGDPNTFDPGSNMKVFNLNTGDLVATVPENFIPGAFFNEVAIDNGGNVYISDTFNPQIWTVDQGLTDATVLVNNDLLLNPDPNRPFGLNGLAITPDENYLIASVMDRLDAGDGRLVRINLSNNSVDDIELRGDDAVNAFAGSDGMFFYNGSLFMVNVFSSAGAIITAEFGSDFSTADLVIRDRFQSVYNRPTASEIRNGRLWTVNSQLDHIIDDNNGALGTPAETPFQVVHVSLDELLAN